VPIGLTHSIRKVKRSGRGHSPRGLTSSAIGRYLGAVTESNSFWGAMRGCGAALIVLVTLVFVCGVFAVVYYFTTPEGETVAVLPADGRIAASVEAGPGDTLHFTLSYEFPLGGFGMFDGPARDNAIDRALRASSLHVVATSSSGAVLDARCAPYNGRVGVESDIMGTRSLSDALTDCVITIPAAGTFSVVGAVTWSPELRASEEMLEVRRATPSR
jgi:hypothetical protein